MPFVHSVLECEPNPNEYLQNNIVVCLCENKQTACTGEHETSPMKREKICLVFAKKNK